LARDHIKAIQQGYSHPSVDKLYAVNLAKK
jgi:hypothetical protein